MISQRYLKSLEFETIEDIYNYIVDSEINGAYKQFKELINKLSCPQFKDFLVYIDDFVYLNYDRQEQDRFKTKVLSLRGF